MYLLVDNNDIDYHYQLTLHLLLFYSYKGWGIIWVVVTAVLYSI